MNRRKTTAQRNKARPAAITGRNTPALGRTRLRKPDSARRAPLGTPLATIPAFIRATDSVVDDADKDYLRRKLGRRLGKFSHSVQRVSVRLDDVNGPRGGDDQRCRIKVTLVGLPDVLIESSNASIQGAMDEALARVEHAVKQSLKRRQTRGRHVRAGR
ncbi:MAG: HPF/RaiA family ribosome-associated protein [Gammaproteobacteria bacterium]|nr:HPF/RaiA family ribosome-associated protein [Gammaproteobacteria bacterium]